MLKLKVDTAAPLEILKVRSSGMACRQTHEYVLIHQNKFIFITLSF